MRVSDAIGKNNGAGACTELVVQVAKYEVSVQCRVQMMEDSGRVGIVYSNRAIITR